jgi:hypothetical protein
MLAGGRSAFTQEDELPGECRAPTGKSFEEIAATGFWRRSHVALSDHFAQMCIRTVAATSPTNGGAA